MTAPTSQREAEWTVWDAEARMAREGDWRGLGQSIAHDILPSLRANSGCGSVKERARRQVIAGERLEAAILAALDRPAVSQGEVERETQAVWRCAVGDVTSALDVLKDRWVTSRRKAEREAGAVLSGVLDLVWAYRDPAAGTYEQANANGKKLTERVRFALAADQHSKESGRG